MTGYGSATAAGNLGEIAVEIKSLNNRFLDLSVRLPRELGFLEIPVRDEIKKRVRRGKVDVFVRWMSAPGAQPLYEINGVLLRAYAAQIKAAVGEGNTFDIGPLLNLPGVVNPSKMASEDGELSEATLDVVRQALDRLDASRIEEGNSLAASMLSHLKNLEELRDQVAAEKDTLLDEYRTRLRERLDQLARSLDSPLDIHRLETEIMLYTDRSDITEELTRLAIHFKAFRALAQKRDADPIGKPMDFLVQELLREVNTIGNKARGADVAARIVQMKSEIEKIREQVQNLE